MGASITVGRATPTSGGVVDGVDLASQAELDAVAYEAGTDLLLDSGEAIPPDRTRTFATLVASFTSGQMYLAGFTARRTETITKIEAWSGGTAAGATPTLVRFGIYSLAANGDGTLVASTVSDTALFASTYTSYVKSFSASFSKVAGTRYAIAVLIVSGTTMPVLLGPDVGNLSSTDPLLGRAPRRCGLLGGQSDLPASFTEASLSNSRRLPGYRLIV